MSLGLKLLNEAHNVATKIQTIKNRIKEQKAEIEDTEQARRKALADKESGDALIANVKISIERQDQFHIPKIKKVEESLATLREHARQMDEYQAIINAHIHQNEMRIKDLLARQERSVAAYATLSKLCTLPLI